jgi:polyisoprenoid-binding protein YceI
MRSLLLLALLIGAPLATAADFTVLRPQQSSLVFISKQMGVPVDGTFRKFDARLTIDPAKPENGTARIDIDVSSIDVGSQDAYAEVIGGSWFDTAKYPQASFVSSKVTRVAAGRYEVSGKMTIRNVTRDIKAPFTMEQKGDTLIIDGAFPINRLDYGIGSGIWGDTDTVANEVQIRFRFAVASKK